METSIQTDVVLPAGGRLTGEFAQQAGAEIKALIRFDGETILRRVIRAFRATGRVGRVVVIGPEEALQEAQEAGADATLPEGETGPENIFRGLEHLGHGGDRRALIATTDLPFLTPEAIRWFLDACPSEADIAIPAVTREAYEARYPGTGSEFVRLRDGQFTIGCTFLVNPQTLLARRAHLENIFAARKSQWQMANLVGPGIVLRFVTRRLAIRHIVERASRIMGCRGVAVMDAPPELAFDIDLPTEYAYAVKYHSRLPEGALHP